MIKIMSGFFEHSRPAFITGVYKSGKVHACPFDKGHIADYWREVFRVKLFVRSHLIVLHG
jgi:hypothetical protein